MAGGDEKARNYLLDWCAFLLQYPKRKPKAGVYIRSDGEGAGKNLFFDKIGRDIIGPAHYFGTERANDVLGQFNSKSSNRKLIILNECIYAGDAKTFSAFKARITEEMLSFEAKGKDGIPMPDAAGYVMLSNEEQFLKLSTSNRRGICLEASNRYANKSEESQLYFKRLAGVNKYSIAKLLYNRDLSKFSPSIYPKTECEKQQIEGSLDNVASWWKEVLSNDTMGDHNLHPMGFFENHANRDTVTKNKHCIFKKEYVYKCYTESIKNTYGYSEKVNLFWRKLGKMAKYTETRVTVNKKRYLCIHFEDMEVLRNHFNTKYMKYEVKY